MLDVNNVNFNTLPNRKDEEIYFDELSQMRTTIEKNRKKVKTFSKQMCEWEGATVAATHLPFPAGSLIRPDRQRSTTNSHKTVGKSHKILKMSY